MLPVAGLVSPEIIRRRVDFPAPLRPTRPIRSRFPTKRSRDSKRVRCPKWTDTLEMLSMRSAKVVVQLAEKKSRLHEESAFYAVAVVLIMPQIVLKQEQVVLDAL